MMSAKAKALSLLARQAYFSKQLARKLQEKGYGENDIPGVIAELQGRGWLNDQELAKRFIEKQRKKGYGSKVIMQKLIEKAGGDIAKQFALEEESEEEVLVVLIEKRYKKQLPEQKQKVISALLRRGFSLESILRALAD